MKLFLRLSLLLALLSLTALGSVNAQSAKQRLPTKTATDTAGSVRATDTIVDGSFEAGIPNPNWEETSTNFDTPLCTDAACGDGAGPGDPPTAAPRTGTIWAWFGGLPGNEVGTLSQQLTISNDSTATLQFYLWIGLAGGTTDSLVVTLGGTEIFSTLENNAAYQSGYTLVSIDVSSFADGAERTLLFTGTDTAGEVTNINVDDVSLTVQADSGLIVNGGFEPDLAGWTLKNSTSDVVRCNTPTKEISYEGECAFRFKGGVGENSQVRQVADLTGESFEQNDTLTLSGYVATKNASVNGSLRLKITYSDATLPTKLNLSFVSNLSGVYQEITGDATLASGLVASIKTSARNRSTSGKVYLDEVTLVQNAGPALIPLP